MTEPREQGPVETANPFDVIQPEDLDEDDDQDGLIKALGDFAHHVRTGPKPSQKQAKQNRSKKPYTEAEIKEIVAAIKTGKIKLPELKDLSDDNWITLWALMDAG